MGVYAGPEIIENGLVLALDAGNTKSYPGSGTTWTDLSGNGNNGTLTNMDSSNLDSANGGFFTFDNSDEHVVVTSINRLNTTTLDVWFKTSSVSTDITVRQYLYTQQRNPPTLANFTYKERQGVHIAGNVIHFQYLNIDNDGVTLVSSNIISPNVWYNLTVTLDGTTSLMYLNGSLIPSEIWSAASGSNLASKAVDVNEGFIGRRGDAEGNDYFGGNIAIVRDYNRALTAAEVRQNFNATRGRFGI